MQGPWVGGIIMPILQMETGSVNEGPRPIWVSQESVDKQSLSSRALKLSPVHALPTLKGRESRAAFIPESLMWEKTLKVPIKPKYPSAAVSSSV